MNVGLIGKAVCFKPFGCCSVCGSRIANETEEEEEASMDEGVVKKKE